MQLEVSRGEKEYYITIDDEIRRKEVGKMIKKHNLLPGLALILIAVVMMGSAMGLIPDIPWFKLMGSILFAAWGLKSFIKRDFLGGFFSASIIAWIFEDELMF